MTHRAPVVAVLPFTASGPGGDDVLAAGLVEDVSSELTRFRALGVVSPASGAAVARLSDSAVGERLGATHVLRGTVRKGGGQIRVRANLIECADGAQLWADTIEVAEDDLFAAEDELVARITSSLAALLEDVTLARSRREPVGSLAAYELTVRGLALLREGSREADDEARALFRRALELDPAYARAHAGVSLSWFNEWSCEYWSLVEENGRRAYTAAHRALTLDDRDAMLHLVIGRICLYRREFEQAAWYIDRALALCPNDADLLIQLAVADSYLGRPELAVDHARRAIRLNPYHPNVYYAYAAQAHLVARDLRRSLELSARADSAPFVDAAAHVALANAHYGRLDEGRRHLRAFHDAYERQIASTSDLGPVDWFLRVNPYRDPEDRDYMVEGFRLLGEPAADRDAAAGTSAAGSVGRRTVPPGLFAEGDQLWVLGYRGRRVTLPDLKGLHDLRRLLSHPREPIHSLDLSGRGSDTYGGDAVLDEEARSEIQGRIRDLEEEIDEAEAGHDLHRASRAREEKQTLIEALADSLGLGGRRRRLGDDAERARSAVTWRIRHAVKKITGAHPELGRHLSNTVRTGIFCSYEPEGPTRWRTSLAGPEGVS